MNATDQKPKQCTRCRKPALTGFDITFRPLKSGRVVTAFVCLTCFAESEDQYRKRN